MASERIDGHCLCGAVRITVSQPKQHLEICHCDMCRRWGGAFYGALTGESFTIAGEEAITSYPSSDWAERAFCGTCGSNLWYKFLPTGNRSFHAGLFPEANGYDVGKEIFVDEKASWGDLAGDHPRQTGEEVISEATEAGFNFD